MRKRCLVASVSLFLIGILALSSLTPVMASDDATTIIASAIPNTTGQNGWAGLQVFGNFNPLSFLPFWNFFNPFTSNQPSGRNNWSFNPVPPTAPTSTKPTSTPATLWYDTTISNRQSPTKNTTATTTAATTTVPASTTTPTPAPTVANSPTACNYPDPDSSAVDGAKNWTMPLGTFTYYVDTTNAPASIKPYLSSIAAAAFLTWSNAVDGKIKFVESSSESSAQGVISWGNTSAGALATTNTHYSGGVVTSVTTVMNPNVSWTWSGAPNGCKSSAYDIQEIMTHEIGHWMGLTDEYSSNYSNNTMYGSALKGETKKDTLASGDIAALKAIYKL